MFSNVVFVNPRNAITISIENAVNIMTMPSFARLFATTMTPSFAEKAVKTNTIKALMVNTNTIRIINLDGPSIKKALQLRK